MAIDVTNDHIGIVIVQGIWVIKLELSSWWFVDRSYGDTANVDGEDLNVVVLGNLTRFNKIAIQGSPHMAVDKKANSLSRVYSYYPKCNLPLFYV